MLFFQVPPAEVVPAPAVPVRAQYGWGYSGAGGEGTGTLNLLMEPGSGRLVAELHGLGERLLLLEGDRASGYRLQVPRQKVDQRAATLAELPLPFLPQMASVEALLRLLRAGEGPGVSILKQDAMGPLKLHWRGRDPQGREEQVWLSRKRWDGPR
ncbi:hypothetical protein [Geothrix edaphica]|uniref:Uncharacterized protein n=1 Tax=Geothrix edaphica TaxID=2927976 RepID=A0ABQ5PV57_9BACT|nr:hypothetical protein [Geothrix edaphica]GLH66267.1 hypothetical protein GETHED_06310 [Geothrix edaphica]